MTHRYTDYLFALYINSEPVPLEALLLQTGTAGPTAGESPEEVLQVMEARGLIERSQVDGAQYIRLTDRGKGVSVAAADVMTAQMLSRWQQQAPRGMAQRISA